MAESIAWAVPFFSSLVVLLATIGVYVYRMSQYWKRKGVPSIGNVLFGDFKDNIMLKESMGDSVSKHYSKYKHLRYSGSFLFLKPVLTIHDPDLIKEVLVKDFANFGGSGLYYDSVRDPLSANLLFMSGSDWRLMRTKLTPAFTSGKIKYMFGTVVDCISQLQALLEKECAGQNSIIIDVRELMARLTTDVILSVTLGILANSVENPDAKFRKLGKTMFEPSFSQFARNMAFTNLHSFAKLLNIKIAPKEVNDFFMNAVHEAVEYREKNNVRRNDFLDLMIQLKNYGSLNIRDTETQKSADSFMTTNQIAAQAFFFFLAGFETTSSTISFTLFEVAKHPEIQRKIQAECDAAMTSCGGKINYETVQSLEYIEMAVMGSYESSVVVNPPAGEALVSKVLLRQIQFAESQRLHPAVAIMSRATLKDCILPTTNVKLDKDIEIQFSIAGLHRDPKFFPNPDKFDPERFSAQNKSSIPSTVYMPFGVGPRICIGLRFAMVQVKAVILSLLSKYDVELAEGTSSKLEYDPRNFIPAPKVPLMLKFVPRKK